MAKKKKPGAEVHREVEFAGDGSLAESDKVGDEAEGKEDEEKDEDDERKSAAKPPRSPQGSEADGDDDDDADGKRKESVAIPIEDDVPDGKAQRQANSYAAKKTVAQGMMDIALITANANQLRYIITFNRNSPTFWVNVILIIVSLLLQVGVGLSLIFKGRLDLRGQSKHRYAKRINNYVVVGVFLVTIINVFIASFTVTADVKEK